MADLLAGAARLSLEPPLDLPLVGFVRQTHDATGYGRFGLETSAIALEQDGVRVVLCGVDIVGIGEPEITRLLDRIADATGAEHAGILLNWNHTHNAPPPCRSLLARSPLYRSTTSAHSSRRSTCGPATMQSASLTQNRPCCHARHRVFCVAARCEGCERSPSAGSTWWAMSGPTRMASTSPTLGRMGAPQPRK